MTQVGLNRYAFVVLPDMRIDRVNDVWGDAEPWSRVGVVHHSPCHIQHYPILSNNKSMECPKSIIDP